MFVWGGKSYNGNGVKIGANESKNNEWHGKQGYADECRLTMRATRRMLLAAANATVVALTHCFHFRHKKLSLLQYTLLKTSHLNKTYIKCAKKRIILQYSQPPMNIFTCFVLRVVGLICYLAHSLPLSLADLLNVTETKSWHESFARLSTLKNDLSCVSFLCSPPFLALSSPCDVFERSERSSLYDYYSSVLLFIQDTSRI